MNQGNTISRKNSVGYRYRGVWIGIGVILLWTATLLFNFSLEVNWYSPFTYLMILVQAHLYTGLFITAHDAMHGTVAPSDPKLNRLIGSICTFLFIFNSYTKLTSKHHDHHRHVATDDDPDFHRGDERFFFWFFDFVKEYVTIWQIIAAAVTLNVLKFVVPEANLILYWVVPSILSMLQLFFFGTYRPHKGEHAHDNPHHARSQKTNHLWAFFSCYFFGYHFEHHDSPWVPWWRLWKKKE